MNEEVVSVKWVEYPKNALGDTHIVPTNDIYPHHLFRGCECRTVSNVRQIIHSVFYRRMWDGEL